MNQTIKSAILIVITLPILLTLSFATTDAQEVLSRQDRLCDELISRRNTINNNFDSNRQAFENSADKQLQILSGRLIKTDEKLAGIKADHDIDRSDVYNLIIEKQPNEELKQRARNFASEVDQAISARRNAYLAANNAFKDSAKVLLEERNSSTKKAISVFRSSVDSAFNNTSRACRLNRPTADSRQIFIDQLRDARITYSDYLRSRPNFSEQIKQVANVRDQQLKQVRSDFEQRISGILEEYKDLD